MVRYRLVPSQKAGDLSVDFQKIIAYLLTFVGEVSVQAEALSQAVISYTDSPIKATLETDNKSGQIILTCEKTDYLSVNLVKNVASQISYRIFNTLTKSYLLNDPNILDLTTIKLESSISNVFSKYHLVPLFQYRESLVFFAKDQKGRLHLINRHLLEYLQDQPMLLRPAEEFSVIVAPDITRFVALMDRGLIPLSFYKCLSGGTKITNLSGFNIDKFPQQVIVEPIYFHLDARSQSFTQENSPAGIAINKGQSLTKTLKLKKYLALKIAQDVGFAKKAKNLIPKLSVSVFLDA